MKSSQAKVKKAFSLLELSIVTIIIGILISGVVAGSGLIQSSRLSNARSLTTKSAIFEIDGLVAWYETSLQNSFDSSEALDGEAVTNWYDLTPGSNSDISASVKKNTLISSSSGTIFTNNGINGVPSIKFDGSSDANFILTNSGSSNSFYQGDSSQSTIFTVLQPLSLNSPLVAISNTGSSTVEIQVGESVVNLYAGTSNCSVSNNFEIGSDYIIAGYFNGNLSKVFVNSATTETGSGDAGTNSLSGLTIGTDKNGESGFIGLISEIIVYNRPLKLQERKDIMNYLSKKYKISVTGL
jgi:prepilin-type N-terminal cleavage/methylation domain-containing protein